MVRSLLRELRIILAFLLPSMSGGAVLILIGNRITQICTYYTLGGVLQCMQISGEAAMYIKDNAGLLGLSFLTVFVPPTIGVIFLFHRKFKATSIISVEDLQDE